MIAHPTPQLVVIGGGAAGFFGAITAAEEGLDQILILERGPDVLQKVRISGGGRCNVTHDCFDPAELVGSYPRGSKHLRGAFSRFQPADMLNWLEDRGVGTHTEADGRIFPTTNSSATIIDCFTEQAHNLGVRWQTRTEVDEVVPLDGGGFELTLKSGDKMTTPRLLIATGGIRLAAARKPATDCGHRFVAPTPSLFTFKISDRRLENLAGVSVPKADLECLGHSFRGPILITHWGLSGPAVLKLSAFAARDLANCDYRAEVVVNWIGQTAADAHSALDHYRQLHSKGLVRNHCPFPDLTRRLWQRLLEVSDVAPGTTWAHLSKTHANILVSQLTASHFQTSGKTLNKEEFVTAGGVVLDDLVPQTMESRRHPGLYFAGEVLNVDGITGGFNFQAAWTTAYLAGKAAANFQLPSSAPL